MSFLTEAMKTERTWNGAISNSTTQSALLDYFFKCGTYRNRSQEAVNNDMVRIFAEDSDKALKLVFGLRLITRTPKNIAIEENQTGFGNRDEFYKAIVWMHHNANNLLYQNLHLIPVFGSWKDFFNEPLINTLCQEYVQNLVYTYLNSNNSGSDLLRKYLPQIRTKKRTRSVRDGFRSLWAKNFCKRYGITFRQYRKLKSGGAAHIFQKQMSSNQWDKLHFNGIPGKAMFNLMNRTGKDGLSALERHGQLDRLLEWSLSQKSIKFTGYPYELTAKADKTKNKVQKAVLNKQWETILETFKGHKLGNVLAAMDTSGSMTLQVAGKTTALDICTSMGIVFSMLNTGYFKDHVAAFSDHSKLFKLYGDMTDRLQQIKSQGWWMGSTNFQSLIDLICDIRRNNPEIPLQEFPETLLIISDMQFNPGYTASYGWRQFTDNAKVEAEKTNYEIARNKLQAVDLPEMRIIWWCVNGQTSDFPSTMEDKGVYMIGGFDPANLKSLMGLTSNKPNFKASEVSQQTPEDGFKNWLSQPIFDLITV